MAESSPRTDEDCLAAQPTGWPRLLGLRVGGSGHACVHQFPKALIAYFANVLTIQIWTTNRSVQACSRHSQTQPADRSSKTFATENSWRERLLVGFRSQRLRSPDIWVCSKALAWSRSAARRIGSTTRLSRTDSRSVLAISSHRSAQSKYYCDTVVVRTDVGSSGSCTAVTENSMNTNESLASTADAQLSPPPPGNWSPVPPRRRRSRTWLWKLPLALALLLGVLSQSQDPTK